ncbi:GSCFA domain-containing protein [Hyunsoonleella pacifica]|uniref:GSCFA domain-containing protein n=1 Tax=Hyunsoonleella pacifica TaxID=1080224 RepID=A0A4Q9FKT7_9FLAO|nr:GSCFA domain-containing protein [Hyunsoonleella pacifica]TBN14320.1 GSCFA domain-containing protein [Hyunsoonleella pacifica]GGD12772.1 hypothetical protein GCM10011368_13440 [Hyunsoonleella pacifica]
MNLQTKISLSKQSDNLIDYNSKLLLLGSCFSENIGNKLEYFKFQSYHNPLGILFHPKAIENLVSHAVADKIFLEDDVFQYNDLWHCFDAHSKLSSSVKNDVLQTLNTQIQVTKKNIQDATHVIITLGTAWVYRFVKTHNIVANCHKVPQKEFNKELLTVDDICHTLQNISTLIRNLNSKVSILFTVSPVRHIKDGFVENMQSKAHLIAGIHKMIGQELTRNHQLLIVNQKSYYFPSYEIMMDELRDYRFYNEDMIHPNQTAVNYIWEKFKVVWISEESYEVMEHVETIQKGLQHKPFNPNSEAHQKFLQKLEVKKAQIISKFPHISF